MIVAALALAGIFISLYLTLYKLGFIGELSCTIGSCETVNTSKWSRFLGLPVAAWGVLFYLDVFVIALAGTLTQFEDEPAISLVLVAEADVPGAGGYPSHLHLVRHVSSYRDADTCR
jgi:uncharacterized membrane protein